MEIENHFGEPFNGCPHCGSINLEEIPTVNLTRKYACVDCHWLFGVDMFKKTVKGCFHTTPEEHEAISMKELKKCINEVVDKLKQ